tara:strand:- start:278 stop:499 length:222 start_codon:yes stop_codon:yes gene_type:complete
VKKTKNFELAFAKIYPNFTSKLLANCDDLTSIEIKICMLLKISSSTFLNSRSIIRKKLGLKKNQKLINTIIKI